MCYSPLGEAANAAFLCLALEGGQIDDGLLGSLVLLRADERAADDLLKFEDGADVFEAAESFGEGHESVLLREESTSKGGRDVPENAGSGVGLFDVKGGLNLL